MAVCFTTGVRMMITTVFGSLRMYAPCQRCFMQRHEVLQKSIKMADVIPISRRFVKTLSVMMADYDDHGNSAYKDDFSRWDMNNYGKVLFYQIHYFNQLTKCSSYYQWSAIGLIQSQYIFPH